VSASPGGLPRRIVDDAQLGKVVDDAIRLRALALLAPFAIWIRDPLAPGPHVATNVQLVAADARTLHRPGIALAPSPSTASRGSMFTSFENLECDTKSLMEVVPASLEGTTCVTG